MTMTNLEGKTQAELLAIIAKLSANQAQPKSLSFKVTAKKPDGTGTDGAVSVYGLGRFPITLYAGQWERLIAAIPQLEAFIAANAATISRKGE